MDILRLPFQIKLQDGKSFIDFQCKEGGIFGPAIYELNDNRLTICWNPKGPRPTEFSTKSGDGRSLIRLQRVGEAKK